MVAGHLVLLFAKTIEGERWVDLFHSCFPRGKRPIPSPASQELLMLGGGSIQYYTVGYDIYTLALQTVGSDNPTIVM